MTSVGYKPFRKAELRINPLEAQLEVYHRALTIFVLRKPSEKLLPTLKDASSKRYQKLIRLIVTELRGFTTRSSSFHMTPMLEDNTFLFQGSTFEH